MEGIGTWATLFLILFQICSADSSTQVSLKHDTLGVPDELHEFKEFKVPNPRYRLPLTFIPYHYDVTVRPILDEGPNHLTAPGHVVIQGTCELATRNITLHSVVEIDESSVQVTNLATMDPVEVRAHIYDEEKTFYIIELGTSLDPGIQYSIEISYTAQVNTEQLEGLYRNHYVNPYTGEDVYSIATQLQAFGARKVFPSFDEPALKATFTMTIGRREEHTTICNAPLISSLPINDIPGWYWDYYNQTVKMPTYLVAIIVSDFTSDDATEGIYHKPVKTFGPRHLIQLGYGNIASDIAALALYYFEMFFNVEYSMHKMDSIGIIDFPAGAMENWGLNIYKEDYLLYSEEIQNNENNRRGVAFTLNHELAHQWAGNLVTCDWWTMAWLNEGFATYLSYLGMNYTNPEFETMKLLQVERSHVAMRNDMRDDAHPTVLPDKGNPWDTMTYNANLVYSKGAALMWMMQGFLTLETLQSGLETFMKTFSYGAANQDQFFTILTSQADADGMLPNGTTIKLIMDTWTLQKGFPLVTVERNGDHVTLTQKEYEPTDNETRVYYIPIAVATQSEPNFGNTLPSAWLFQEPEVNIDLNPGEWIVVNSGGTGYYKVEYNDELTNLLQNQLQSDHHQISLGSRTQLIEDYFQFAEDRNGVGIEKALGLTKYFRYEMESSVWRAFRNHMSTAINLLPGTQHATAFKNYLRPRVSRVFSELTNSEIDLTKGEPNLFHADLTTWSAFVETDDVNQLASGYFTLWRLNPNSNPIPPILYQAILRAGIKFDDNFLFALSQFEAEPDATKSTLINGLTYHTDLDSLYRLLGVLHGETTEIDQIYSAQLLYGLSLQHLNKDVVLGYMNYYFDSIAEYQGAGIIAVGIEYLCRTYSSQENLTAVEEFLATHASQFTDEEISKIETGIAQIGQNIAWMDSIGNKMGAWFANNL